MPRPMSCSLSRVSPGLAFLLALGLARATLADDWLYLTYPGDTLIGIGQQYLKNPNDWPRIQQANQLKNPRHLPTGTRIRIPVELLKLTPAPATVTHAKGNVRFKPADGPFRKLETGDSLGGGETLITGPNSFVTIRLADGSIVNQQPGTKLTFGRLAAYGKTGMVSTELNLEAGRLEASASKQVAPAGGFRVATPVAVAGLRGTSFRLNMAEDGKTLRGEVLEGAVGVAGQGSEVGVQAGQGTIAEAGRPPAPPRPLLPAPDLTGLPERVDSLPLNLAWAAAQGTAAWRAQVASDADFQQIVLDDRVTSPQVQWTTDLQDGRYVLRVRAIDPDGLEGMNRDHPFELDARPLPPQAVAPLPDARFYSEQVDLVWAASPEARGYLLQLSTDGSFGPGTRESRLDAVTRHGETLPTGTWHWRLASLDDQGLRHGWGEPGRFRVQPLPQPPQAQGSAEPGQAHFAWRPVAGSQTYEFQLGTEASLEQPRTRQQTADTRMALTDLEPGRYWWRLRGLEADGQAGAWSPASPVVVPPQAPILDAPAEGQRLAALSGNLAWQPSPGARGYRVQFARDSGFTATLVDSKTESDAQPVRVETPGTYHWRVAGLDADGAPGPWSPPRSLRLQPPPAMPQALQAREDNHRLLVTWQGQAARYSLELAKDPDFARDVQRIESADTEQRLVFPQPGQYWLRVIAYDQEGLASQPSTPLPVQIKQAFPWWLLPFLLVIP